MDRSPAPRVTAVMGVARALLVTVPVREACAILVDEFGWDVSFQALALMRGDGADAVFARLWESLLTAPLARDLLGGVGDEPGP